MREMSDGEGRAAPAARGSATTTTPDARRTKRQRADEEKAARADRERARIASDNRLLALVRQFPEGVTVAILAERLDLSSGVVGAALRRLHEAHAVSHDRRSTLNANYRARWLATSTEGEVRTKSLEKGHHGRRRRVADLGPVNVAASTCDVPAPGARVAHVTLAQLASPSDRIRCSYLSATLAASACAGRQVQQIRPCCVCPAPPELDPSAPSLGAEVRRRLAVLAKETPR